MNTKTNTKLLHESGLFFYYLDMEPVNISNKIKVQNVSFFRNRKF